MLTLNLIFLWSWIKLLIKRSENCNLPRPKPKLKQNSYKFLHLAILLLLFYIHWTQLQIIYGLLLISGIERNPVPELSNLTKSKTCTKNIHGICNISHTCEVRGCNIEIFASCHCDSYEGHGPLLCYNHFINNSCKNSRTKSDIIPSQKSKQIDSIEYSTCFNSISISIVRLSPSAGCCLNKQKATFTTLANLVILVLYILFFHNTQFLSGPFQKKTVPLK